MAASGERVLTPLRSCVVSAAWGCVVFTAGFWLPAYRSLTATCRSGAGGECTATTESSSTLVAVSGYGVLYWLAAPVIASVLVGGLVLVSNRAGRLSYLLAWCVVGVLWVVTLVSMASVGLLFVPSAALLTVAAVRMSAAADVPVPAR